LHLLFTMSSSTKTRNQLYSLYISLNGRYYYAFEKDYDDSIPSFYLDEIDNPSKEIVESSISLDKLVDPNNIQFIHKGSEFLRFPAFQNYSMDFALVDYIDFFKKPRSYVYISSSYRNSNVFYTVWDHQDFCVMNENVLNLHINSIKSVIPVFSACKHLSDYYKVPLDHLGVLFSIINNFVLDLGLLTIIKQQSKDIGVKCTPQYVLVIAELFGRNISLPLCKVISRIIDID